MNCYIVIETSGEYEDRCEKPIAVFESPFAALDFIEMMIKRNEYKNGVDQEYEFKYYYMKTFQYYGRMQVAKAFRDILVKERDYETTTNLYK